MHLKASDSVGGGGESMDSILDAQSCRYGCIYNNHLLIPLLLIPVSRDAVALPWMLRTLAAHTIALSLLCQLSQLFFFFNGWLAKSSLITSPSATGRVHSDPTPNRVSLWRYQCVFMKDPGQEFSIFVKTKLRSIMQSVIKVFVV